MLEDSRSPSLSRRIVLITAGTAPFLALTGSWAEAGAKVSQSAAHYQSTAKAGQDCDDCANFVGPHACKLVDGDISPKGWCRLWVKKSA
jgi:hypothetical protein